MHTTIDKLVEFQCANCSIWYPSPIAFNKDDLRILYGMRCKCPCCFQSFAFDDANVRFTERRSAQRTRSSPPSAYSRHQR